MAAILHVVIHNGLQHTCGAGNGYGREHYKPSLRFSSPLPLDITLLGYRKLDTLALGQRDPWLYTLANNEDVAYPGYA